MNEQINAQTEEPPTQATPLEQAADHEASMSASGFFIFTAISLLMAIYILVHVVGACRQHKALVLKQKSQQSTLSAVLQTRQRLLNFPGGSNQL